MASTVTFIPSGSPVTLVLTQYAGASFALPAVDGGNLDLLIANNGISPAWLSFAGSAPVGPNAAGNVFVPAGVAVLCTTNATTLAAAAADPLVLNAQNGAWQTATQISGVAQQTGGSVMVTRGTATARATF